MGAPSSGANIIWGNQSRTWAKVLQFLGYKGEITKVLKTSKDLAARKIWVFTKTAAGTAPQSSTAADAPTQVGDLCLYYNSSTSLTNAAGLYICTAYTSSSNFTWTQVA
jgi:hypothetical protein